MERWSSERRVSEKSQRSSSRTDETLVPAAHLLRLPWLQPSYQRWAWFSHSHSFSTAVRQVRHVFFLHLFYVLHERMVNGIYLFIYFFWSFICDSRCVTQLNNSNFLDQFKSNHLKRFKLWVIPTVISQFIYNYIYIYICIIMTFTRFYLYIYIKHILLIF